MINNESARPTHVQHYSRLSYDKMLNYIDELEKKGMICRGGGGLTSITNKGREFIYQYGQLINLIESVGLWGYDCISITPLSDSPKLSVLISTIRMVILMNQGRTGGRW